MPNIYTYSEWVTVNEVAYILDQDNDDSDRAMTKRKAFDSLRWNGAEMSEWYTIIYVFSGYTFGKRNFDEIDRARFSAFAKRNFDELDRAGFGALHKRNFDELDRAGFGSFHKRNFDELDRNGFGSFNRYFK